MMRILILGCLILVACTKTVSDNGYTQVQLRSALSYDEELLLRFSAPEDGKYNVQLKVGHTEDYAYENLYLKYALIEGRDTLIDDVKSFALMDGQGLWKGVKNSNGFEIEETLKTLNLSAKKDYELHVEQYSRDNPLDGVNMIAVGILPI